MYIILFLLLDHHCFNSIRNLFRRAHLNNNKRKYNSGIYITAPYTIPTSNLWPPAGAGFYENTLAQKPQMSLLHGPTPIQREVQPIAFDRTSSSTQPQLPTEALSSPPPPRAPTPTPTPAQEPKTPSGDAGNKRRRLLGGHHKKSAPAPAAATRKLQPQEGEFAGGDFKAGTVPLFAYITVLCALNLTFVSIYCPKLNFC